MRFIFVLLLFIVSTAAKGRWGGGARTSHSYPASNGYSGSSSRSHYSGTNYGGSHSYPPTNGLSGNNGYQTTNTRQTYHQTNTAQYNYNHKTEVHNHYHYSPPQQIIYGSTYHPVYIGSPPLYVYEYRDSGSRYDSLLTGLALYNLGRNSAHHYHGSDMEYRGTPGEICKIEIRRGNGEFEQTRINCNLISSFIWEASSGRSDGHQVLTSNTVTTTTTNTTNSASGTNTVSVKTETTVQDALQVKGPSLSVTKDMICSVIRISRDSSVFKKNVECALLQEYAVRSLRRNNGTTVKPLQTVLLFSLIVFVSRLYS